MALEYGSFVSISMQIIGGFRGGAEGASPPLFFLNFQNVFERVNVTNMPRMLYAACPEKESFYSVGGGGGEVEDTAPSF